MNKKCILLLFLTSCGSGGLQVYNPTCVISKTDNVSTVTCPDGSTSTIVDGISPTPIPGPTGAQGEPGTNGDTGSQGVAGNNGLDGSNGHSAVIGIIDALPSQCLSGGSVFTLGIDTNDNNELDASDSSIQSAVICNGVKGDQGNKGDIGDQGAKGDTGAQGNPGQNASITKFTPVSVITPCGLSSSPYKEVLLCLNDGNILASFSDTQAGYNTRFAFISPGTFMDTDSSGCIFTVLKMDDNSLKVNWSSGQNQYSTWSSDSIICQKN